MPDRKRMQYRLVSAAPADGEVFVEISLTDPRFSRGYDIREWGEVWSSARERVQFVRGTFPNTRPGSGFAGRIEPEPIQLST
jgi:hypothetical protein